MQMPVLKRTNDGESELVLLDLDEVLYIKIENRNIVYHTHTEKYLHISTLSDLEDHLFPYGFDMLDKTNIVNMNRIKKMDYKHGNVYFEETPTKDSKYASVAFIKQKMLGNQIDVAIARNTNASMEISGIDPAKNKESAGFLRVKNNISPT